MHSKIIKYRSKLISISAVIAVLFAGLAAQSVRAVSANPSPVCVGTSCSVTFDYTGDYFLWSPPVGARNVTFDLMGAQGGRSGGLGGRVVGAFVTMPTSVYVYVGGAGTQGSGAVGGFNGGGNAGTGRGDEGSGGGATDIRTSTTTSSRIAVAAGGGGAGGFTGGAGGNGGGTTGSAGTTGQGQGGAGGTQTAGGAGGYPNGGSWGANGDIAQGGTGGSSSTSGGGGGGGGYYGGGGGGADIDACCTNAGGGGGGSSWASSVAMTSVAHTAAYRAGAGRAIINYQMPPAVISFAPSVTRTNLDVVNYTITFNENVSGLTSSDFSTTGSTANYSALTVTGTGASYSVSVSGCSSGTLKLVLNSGTVSGGASGPIVSTTASDVVIDVDAPTASVSSPASPSNSSILNYAITFSEPVTGLSATDFSVGEASCLISEPVGSNASYSVAVSGCIDSAQVQLTLIKNSVQDSFTNSGPASSVVFATVLMDRSVPDPIWSPISATSLTSPKFDLTIAEVTSGLSVNKFTNIGTATGCLITLTEIVAGKSYSVNTAGCSLGTVQLALAAGSYSDSLGNLGPAVISTSSAVEVIAPAPTPTPTITPTQNPISAPTTEPVLPPVDSSEQPAPIEPTVPQDPELQEPAPQEPTPEQDSSLLDPVIVAPSETQAPTAPTYYLGSNNFEATVENPAQNNAEVLPSKQITVTNPTENNSGSQSVDWVFWISISAQSLAAGLATVGLAKAVRSLRGRRVLRRFS